MMNKSQLVAVIKASGKVPNYDAAMHAEAILEGAYTLADLLGRADAFYGFDEYAHESALMDSI